MNVNTVTISTEDYNELRDFKTAIEAKNTIIVELWGNISSIVSESDMVKACVEEIKGLKSEVRGLKSEINSEKTEIVGSLREMSLWMLLKWKFKNN